MQCVGIAQLDRASILLPQGANHAVPDFRSLSCSQLRELLSNGAGTSSMSAFRYFPLSKKTKISFSPVSPYSSEVERVRVGGLDACAVEMPFTNSSLSVCTHELYRRLLPSECPHRPIPASSENNRVFDPDRSIRRHGLAGKFGPGLVRCWTKCKLAISHDRFLWRIHRSGSYAEYDLHRHCNEPQGSNKINIGHCDGRGFRANYGHS